MIQIGIVEDDASVGKALARLLRGYGYECAVFQSAEAALAHVHLRKLNCLIVDVQLGGMDGFEFSEKLDAAGANIPRIFLSAYIDREMSDVPHSSSGEILLLKPVDEQELLASIKRAMAIHRE